MEERVKFQQQYATTLHKKSEFEWKVEGAIKENNEAGERVMKALQEKDEVEIMAQKTQAVV